PIPSEKHSDPTCPDPAPLNSNLKLYTAAMADVAKAAGVPFVDLFTASQRAYAQVKQPLTINGVHLTDDGYRALAPMMFKALFGEAPPSATERGSCEELRSAVNAKNATWVSSYR